MLAPLHTYPLYGPSPSATIHTKVCHHAKGTRQQQLHQAGGDKHTGAAFERASTPTRVNEILQAARCGDCDLRKQQQENTSKEARLLSEVGGVAGNTCQTERQTCHRTQHMGSGRQHITKKLQHCLDASVNSTNTIPSPDKTIHHVGKIAR